MEETRRGYEYNGPNDKGSKGGLETMPEQEAEEAISKGMAALGKAISRADSLSKHDRIVALP